MGTVSFSRDFLSRAQILRGEVGGIETLHSMLLEDIELISDPDVRAIAPLSDGKGGGLFSLLRGFEKRKYKQAVVPQFHLWACVVLFWGKKVIDYAKNLASVRKDRWGVESCPRPPPLPGLLQSTQRLLLFICFVSFVCRGQTQHGQSNP